MQLDSVFRRKIYGDYSSISRLCPGFYNRIQPISHQKHSEKTVLTCTDFLSFSLTVHTTPVLPIPYLTCKHPTDNSTPLYKASEDLGIWVSIGLSISTNIKGQIESPQYSTVSGMKLVPNYRRLDKGRNDPADRTLGFLC